MMSPVEEEEEEEEGEQTKISSLIELPKIEREFMNAVKESTHEHQI